MTTFLVTGANSGLGFETTRLLAKEGARVVMAVRDLARGQAALDRLRQELPDARLEVAQVDLLDLSSVRALAARELEVDVLINNAGVGSGPLRLSAQGVVEPFAANHLGHFVLTALMLERLERRADPRVVTVSSGFGKRGTLDFDNLDGSKGYSQGKAYMQSKLANALFGAELDRRLRARGSKVKSIVTHPGIAATEMQQKPTGMMGVAAKLVSLLLAKPPHVGARASVEAAIGSGVQGGEVYGPGPVKEPTWPSMKDLEQARRLWERSETLSGVRFPV
jgi:NAD(P)-dependent dehydrogenase (short-subunit alcohol dehydrogenase family)